MLEESIARPRRGHFNQNSRKLQYFYRRVATSNANHIESPVSGLWFVEYSKRAQNGLLLGLVLEEAIARPRRGRFIQNYGKLYYFYGRVVFLLMPITLPCKQP